MAAHIESVNERSDTVLEALCFPAVAAADGAASGDDSTACPLCDERYCLAAARDEFLAHLLREHKFVIGEVHQVADMKRYVEYWKEKFQVSPLTEFCGVIKTNSKETDLGQEEYYFLLCDVLPEDKELREKLQRKKLEEVLIQQEKERTNSSFCRGCLFCKNQFSGSRGRQELLNHMAHLHGFSLGLPDNLVFTDELLDLLQDRVTKLYCLCCEKVFKDRMVLKEHMRKKKHKQLNPNNPEYDKFYVINYMGLGKDWRKVQSQLECENERDDTDIPAGSSQSETENIGDDHEDDKDWTDWVEEEKERVGGGVVCLFCSCSHSELDASLTHMKEAHQFDLKAIISSQQLSFYQQVKLVNFVRRQMHQHRCPYCDSRLSSEKELEDHMQKEGHVGKVPDSCSWDQPQYFFPTYENDNLLSLLDDDNDDDGGSGAVATVIAEDAPATRTSLTAEDLADLAIS